MQAAGLPLWHEAGSGTHGLGSSHGTYNPESRRTPVWTADDTEVGEPGLGGSVAWQRAASAPPVWWQSLLHQNSFPGEEPKRDVCRT